MNKNPLIIYQTKDGSVKIETPFENQMVWLSVAQIADLFQRGRSVIVNYIKNLFNEGELDENLICLKFAHTTQHGTIKGKTQTKDLKSYNLNVIISVGYLVKSHSGILSQ